MRRAVGLITARGGSKGLPGKNVMALCGKPMIAYTIEAAAGLDDVVLSSDDAEIARVARDLGARVPFTRPDALATDEATSLDVVLHAVDALSLGDDDVLVLLQPTSPLRTRQDVTDGVALHTQTGEPVISVTPFGKPLSWLQRIEDGALSPRFPEAASTRRQDGETLYLPNGALYVATVAQWRARGATLARGARALVMPNERSIDVDDAIDFALAEAIMNRTTTR